MAAPVQISVSVRPDNLADLERLCLLARSRQMTDAAYVVLEDHGRVTVRETASEGDE